MRAVRGGEHARVHPGQPVITIGAGDELTALRAYECGSDHHLADSTGYLLRAVLAAVARRALEDAAARQSPSQRSAAMTQREPLDIQILHTRLANGGAAFDTPAC